MLRLLRMLLGLCEHHDTVLTHRELDSPAQQFAAASEGKEVVNCQRTGVPRWFYRAKFITVVRCSKCCRVRHIESVNP